MADTPDVQTSDITPEDFDGVQDTSKGASPEAKAIAEVKPEGEAPQAEIVPPDVATKDTEEKPEDKPEGEIDETVVQPTRADERKTQLSTEIRDLVAQRNTLKEEVAKANSEVYQPATEQELEDEGLSATDAKVEALRQSIEVRDYNDKVADAQLTIESESQRVLTDFPTFNPDSKDYDVELSNEAAQLLRQNLILDPNTGQVIGSNVSPYQLYKTLDRASGISGQKGQLKGQQSTEQMLANADTNSSAAPPAKAKDPLTALWAEPL
jgi:hypothetical protein